MPPGAGSCAVEAATAPSILIGEPAAATFTFASTGLHSLCYAFAFRASDGLHPLSPFQHIQTSYVSVIDVEGASPHNTAVGCTSTLTITGSGFASLSAAETLGCDFEVVGVTTARVLNDRTLACETAAGGVASTTTRLSLRVGSFLGLLLLPAFRYYDSSLTVVSSSSPDGGNYRSTSQITFQGFFGAADASDVRCRFGADLDSDAPGNVSADGTVAICTKPRFPDARRAQL
eukprot:scaffold16434_cov96-Isochrysis_galbana.AAC.1